MKRERRKWRMRKDDGELMKEGRDGRSRRDAAQMMGKDNKGGEEKVQDGEDS